LPSTPTSWCTHIEPTAHHAVARDALTAAATDERAFGIPWPCVHEFYSIVTHPRIYDPPSTAPEALAAIAAICLSHGVTELWTADRDFSYFPELRTNNPLVA